MNNTGTILTEREHGELSKELSPVIDSVLALKTLDADVLTTEAQKIEDLIKNLKGMMADEKLPVVVAAEGLKITSDEDLEGYVESKKSHNEKLKLIKAFSEKYKKPAKRLHAALCDVEKLLSGPFSEARGIEDKERDRYLREREEKAAKEAKEAKELRDKEVANIRRALQRNLSTVGDIQKGIEQLEGKLENPDISDIEYDAISAELVIAKGKLSDKSEVIEEKTAAIEEHHSMSHSSFASKPETKGVGGLKEETVPVRVYNPMAVLGDIVKGDVPITVLAGNGLDMKAWSLSGMKTHLKAAKRMRGVETKKKRI